MKTHQEKFFDTLCGVLLVASAMLLVSCSNTTRPMKDQEPGYREGGSFVADPDHVGLLRDKWGVEILGIRTTATGYMLDFRYHVIDAEKAAPLLDRRIKPAPYVIVEKDNAKLEVPVTSKLGALRQTTFNVKANRNYFVLFSNPSRHVLSGDKVTVVIGDFKVEHLVVL